MKGVHVSASLSRSAGGIFEIELALAKHLQSLDVISSAVGLEDENWSQDSIRWDSVPACVCPVAGPRSLGFSPTLIPRITDTSADIAHLHTMWMYPSVAVSKWAATTGKMYLVTPNGMLEPWALRNSAWKKKLVGILYENRMLNDAACLHANTGKELRDIRTFGLKNPVAVIPNGVELPEIRRNNAEARTQRKQLLFLGRLHPKKGLINALRAWSSILETENRILGNSPWQFVIAGWDQGGHEADLKRLCNELGMAFVAVPASDFLSGNWKLKTGEPSIIFTGPAFGQTKDALIRQATAFILPSFSEGLPMSVLEAWSYGLPVLMTDHCNLPEGFAADAAIRIGTEVDSIAGGLGEMIRSSNQDLQLLGENGRTLVERRFTWPQVAAQMKELYGWVLGGGVRPSFVHTR